MLLRAAVIWAGLRAALFLIAVAQAGLTVGSSAPEGQSGAMAFFALIAVVGVLALIDARVTRELVFLRNLGLSRTWLFGMTALAAGSLELVLRWVLS